MKIIQNTIFNPKKAARYLNSITQDIKSSEFPLEKLDLAKLEGIQQDIAVFEDVTLPEIKFLAKNFSVLNIARGCVNTCSHCLRNAMPPLIKSTILWEDLVRFVDGIEKLNERFGLNILNGNKYLALFNDFNPPVVTLSNQNGTKFDYSSAIKLVFDKLGIPITTVTTGWAKHDRHSEAAASKLVDYFQKNPQANALTSISVNPFHGLLEKSRSLAKDNHPDSARQLKDLYVERLAHAIEMFLPLYEQGKASIIFRHAPENVTYPEFGLNATVNLYQEIYDKLISNVGKDRVVGLDYLNPKNFAQRLPERLIEPKGRGRQFFTKEENLIKQLELINEKADWELASQEQRLKQAHDYTIKEVDIDGKVYATTLSESYIPTDIQLNFMRKDLNSAKIYSDVKLSELKVKE